MNQIIFISIFLLQFHWISLVCGQYYIQSDSVPLSSRFLSAVTFIPNVGIIVVGGRQTTPNCTSNYQSLGDIWIIKPLSSTYSYVGMFPTMKIAEAGFSHVNVNGIDMMLICGGSTGGYVSDILSCYRTSDGITFTSLGNHTAIWNTPPDCPSMATTTGWTRLNLASDNNIVYLTGGLTYQTGCEYTLTPLNPYVYKSYNGGETWSIIGDWRNSTGMKLRSDHGGIVHPITGALYIIGGSNNNLGPLNDAWSSIDGGITFQEITASAPFSPRETIYAFWFNNLIHIVGGWNGLGPPYYQSVWVASDITTNSWQDLTLPSDNLDKEIDCLMNPPVIETVSQNPSAIMFGASSNTNKEIAIRYTFDSNFGLTPSTLIQATTQKPIQDISNSQPTPFPLVYTFSIAFGSLFVIIIVVGICFYFCLLRLKKINFPSKKSTITKKTSSNLDFLLELGTSNESSSLLQDIYSVGGTSILSNLGSGSGSGITGSMRLSDARGADILSALTDRLNPDVNIRRQARYKMESGQNDDVMTQIIMNWMEKGDLIHKIEDLPKHATEQNWLPLVNSNDNDLSLFDVGAARPYQRTPFYTLIGDDIPESDPDPMKRGLVKPLNMLQSGKMEGINSIVWQAVVGKKMCVMKGLLPFNNLQGYEQHFRNFEAEYKIPLQIPPHPHIIRILHQFNGSAVLVYPWLAKNIIDMNNVLTQQTGKRFIRRQTTYVVMEYYPSSLRKYLSSSMNVEKNVLERRICLIAYQLLDAVCHLSLSKFTHRDIKSDNIFIAEDGRLILGDFGCALECENKRYRKVTDLTFRVGFEFGIPPEVNIAINKGPNKENPEQLWDIVCKYDVYSIGVLLCDMLGISIPTWSPLYRDQMSESISHISKINISNHLITFLLNLIQIDESKRLSAIDAKYQCGMILWGPSNVMSEGSSRRWMHDRRLDLFFNASVNSDEFVGKLSSSSEWPPSDLESLEYKLCINFFRSLNHEH